jgi:uncharacterized protein YecE (DUF72 family)
LGSPQPCYPEQLLESWIGTLSDRWRPQQDVFVYFNNDFRACALRDAVVFARIAQQRGLEATRVPELNEVHVS